MSRERLGTATLVVSALALLGGCGAASVHTVDALVAEAGVCGTHANPGILQLVDLVPPMGATVDNFAIPHGFTVVNAPAEFSNFELRFGPTHTAGSSNPPNPRFALATVGNNVVYQLTIVSWSRSPGHVELLAGAGFDTSAGCAWSFPSPLFSYDIVGGPDGGASPEAGVLDGAGSPIDGSPTPIIHLDAPLPPPSQDGGGADAGAEMGGSADGWEGETGTADAPAAPLDAAAETT